LDVLYRKDTRSINTTQRYYYTQKIDERSRTNVHYLKAQQNDRTHTTSRRKGEKPTVCETKRDIARRPFERGSFRQSGGKLGSPGTEGLSKALIECLHTGN